MSETETKALNVTAEEGKRLLLHLHEQGLIDLDAPMRQLFDRMDSTGDVSGYQLTSTTKYGGPNSDQWWVYIDLDTDDDGGRSSRVFAGSDLKDAGLRQ